MEIRGRRRGGARSIEVRVAGSLPSCAQGSNAGPYPLAGGSLRVMLARLLVEMQGAALSLWDDEAGTWWAHLAFPPRG